MSDKKYYLAVDLGATSGRTVIGSLTDDKVELRELTRFGNELIHTGKHVYWDLYALYNEIIKALRMVATEQIPLSSIGIDTWGCDFSLIAADGALLRNPLAYRDPFTNGAMEKYFQEKYNKNKVYELTGIQFMNFNSLFQLYAMQEENYSALRIADKVLFTPDALTYLLTGKAICEYTIASTSEMLNPNKGDLDDTLVKSVGLQRSQFGQLTLPGTLVGTLTPEVQKLTGLGAVPVVAVAGHDTASAVAAVPARDEHFAYLSSGTWSLMGIETHKPIINARSFNLNFTNEGGIEGTTRFLKNICGMWLYERCRREWPELKDLSHAELQEQAAGEEAFRSLINPDDALFAAPDSMTMAINTYCRRTSQLLPETPAQYCRCIFDSLALRYRQVMGYLKEMAPFDIQVLHIIGGGSKNAYLDQFTANSCNIRVLAGPQEGTALGNVMLQAKAGGRVKDVWEMRRIIAHSINLESYEPKDTELWKEAYNKYLEITT